MVDPITLTALAAGSSALIGGASLANTLLNKPQTPSVPPPAAPVQTPTGTPTSNVPSNSGPSFLAAAAMPQGNQAAGAKTLLGQ